MTQLRHYADIMQADERTAAYVTKGHAASAPGLRGHSIGSLYPYTVVAIGAYPTQYAVMDLRTSCIGHVRSTYAAAELDLHSLRIRNLIND